VQHVLVVEQRHDVVEAQPAARPARPLPAVPQQRQRSERLLVADLDAAPEQVQVDLHEVGGRGARVEEQRGIVAVPVRRDDGSGAHVPSMAGASWVTA
jgi:hypothetical protein